MTQKDYELIAECIGKSDLDIFALVELVNILCKAMKEDNPRFSSLKFRVAIGKSMVRERGVK